MIIKIDIDDEVDQDKAMSLVYSHINLMELKSHITAPMKLTDGIVEYALRKSKAGNIFIDVRRVK